MTSTLGTKFRLLMEQQGCPLVDEQGRPQYVGVNPKNVARAMVVAGGLLCLVLGLSLARG